MKVDKVKYFQAPFLGIMGYIHEVHGVKTHWKGRVRL
jgi:hypothetical protein